MSCRFDSKRLICLAFIIASLQVLWLLDYLPNYQKIEVNQQALSDTTFASQLTQPSALNSSSFTEPPPHPHHHSHHQITSTFCHSVVSSNKETSGKNALVVGATSFIGAGIARAFHKMSVPVIASEDNVNIGFDPLAWYRWEQLISMGVSLQFFNFTNYEMTCSFLKKHSPKAIVYVPTPLLEGEELSRDVRQIIELHEDFLLLLEIVKKEFPFTRIILISVSEPKGSYASMIKLFELSLSVYNRLYGTRVSLVRTKGVYGPWQNTKIPLDKISSKIFIKNLADVVKSEMFDQANAPCRSIDSDSLEKASMSFTDGSSLTRKWFEEYQTYLNHQTKDIIASPYFTTKRNAQYPIEFMTNNYCFMENWFKNIYKMNLHMVVFHDDLSDQFVSTFKKNYPKADFDKIKDFKDFRPNDRRYQAYYDYILAHPEIRRIVMTDMRDLIIQNNPFEVMDVLGDIPYVGLDRPFFQVSKPSSVAGVFKRCFDKGVIPLDYHRELEMLSFFNSGVTGGTRHVTLAILTRFLSYFKISTKDNCNMALVGYIYHKYYFDVLATGWPFNTAFITDQPNIPGLAILHKWDLLSFN